MAIGNVADRAPAYGIAGLVTDGNNVIGVYEAAKKAVEHARKGEGPTLLECKTYRRRGHSRVDPAKYRPKNEVEEWLSRDPIRKMSAKLLEEHILTREELQQIDEEVKSDVEKAVRFALDSTFPPEKDALTDVYA